MNPTSPVFEVKDIKFELHAEHSCNSKCCIPKSPKLKRNATAEKVSKSKCNII